MKVASHDDLYMHFIVHLFICRTVQMWSLPDSLQVVLSILLKLGLKVTEQTHSHIQLGQQFLN